MENDWAETLDIEVEEPEAAPLTVQERDTLIAQGQLLQQFLQSEKFVSFVNMNYDLMRNEDSKVLYVVEVPDEVAAQRAMAIMKKQVEDGPRVITPSVAEAKKVLNDPEFLKRAKQGRKKKS